MADTTNLGALVARMPDVDGAAENKKREAKLTGPKWGDAEKVFDQVLEGGREAVVGLIGMVGDGQGPEDYKVRYLLHGLAVYVCRPEKEEQQAMFMEALGSQLGGDRHKAVQGFLVRELEVAGDKRVAPAVGKLLLDDEVGDDAARALLSIGEGAAEQFRRALPNAKGRRRVAILQALGVLRDEASAGALREAMGDGEAEARCAAGWALASMGDRGSIDVLIKASGAAGYERIQMTKACLVLAERLLSGGNKSEAARIYRHLLDTRTDKSEQYVREAAEKGLAGAP